jgi:hypothetical protein
MRSEMSGACLEMTWAYAGISWASGESKRICLENGGACFEVPGA